MIPPEGVKRTLDGLVDSVPLDKGWEVFDGKLTHEWWDKNDSKNFADSDDAHILLKLGKGHYKVLWGVKHSKRAIWPSPKIKQRVHTTHQHKQRP